MPPFNSSIPEDHLPTYHFWKDESATDVLSSLFVCVPDKVAFVITSAVAILITFAGSQSWTIFRFLFYCWARPHNDEEEVLRQLGLVLRNSSSSFYTFASCLRTVWKLRRKHHCIPDYYLIIAMLFSLAYCIVFIALGALVPGLLTENITTLPGDNCGYWVLNSTELEGRAGPEKQLIQLSQLAQYESYGIAATRSYVDLCYGGEAGSSTCNTMINRMIPWTSNPNKPCPFKGQCVGGENSAFVMDTGNISAQYFGINTNSKLSLRRQSTCSPILMAPYQVDTNTSQPVGGYAHVKYNGVNATQTVRNDIAFPYELVSWYPQINMSVHPNLQQSIGNVSVIYISRNDLIHLYPSNDPIFSATEPLPLPALNMTGYQSRWEQRLRALACVETLQFCNDFGHGQECSPWVGVMRGEHNETGLEKFYEQCSNDDRGIISLVLPYTSISQTIGQVAGGSGADLIAAKSLLRLPAPNGQMKDLQTAQGDEQWQLEVAQWFNIILAIMQLAVLFIPLSAPFLNSTNLVNGMADESYFICQNVKINTTAFTSIRYLYIILVFVWVGFGTLLSFVGELLGFFSRVFASRRGIQSSNEWQLDEISNLHSRDGSGEGQELLRAGVEYHEVPEGQENGEPPRIGN